MPQIYDMGPTALLPLWRKMCCWVFRPEKSWWLRPNLNKRTWVLKGSTLPIDHWSISTPNGLRSLNVLLYTNLSRNFCSCQLYMIHFPCIDHRNTISTPANAQWKFDVVQWQISMQRTISVTNNQNPLILENNHIIRVYIQ